MWNPKTYTDTDYGLDSDETFEPHQPELETEPVSTEQPHIMTLLGPIEPSELGICLPHVHLLCAPPNQPADYQLTDPDSAEGEIEAFITMNGRSLVDCSTSDAGRMTPELLGVAGWVPAHIIGVTGRHNHAFASAMPNATDVEGLADEFITDLTTGMNSTDARAGVIKVGTSLNEITNVERCSIQAAAHAHRQTGAPVTTHTEEGTMTLELVSLLEQGGVEANRVILGHLDRVPMSHESLTTIAETGAYLQFDQIGKSDDYTDQQRAEQIVRLCEAGFADQLLLSLDYGRRSLLTSYNGQPGLSYMSEWFMVLLMEADLDAMTIRRLVIDNPARALTIHPPSAQ